ncbi:MAG: DUF429 domain-containing protein [Rubrobacteraceae bacterium]
MKVYGLDFTSAPSKRKPLIAVGCALDDGILKVEDSEPMFSFEGFEDFLQQPGPWVCGMDFPFGQPRSLVEALGWPADWEGYVGEVAAIGKERFEAGIRSDMARRPAGSKWRDRLADRRSGSSSAMMLFRVPVGKMFFQGAPRLLVSGVNVVPCHPSEDTRVALEAYPAVVTRRFLGRRSYKSDERKKQTGAQRSARGELLAGLQSPVLEEAYGFRILIDGEWRERFVREPAADSLDSLLCAVQAAWSYTKKDEGWGIPSECDPNEGWILDPTLLQTTDS